MKYTKGLVSWEKRFFLLLVLSFIFFISFYYSLLNQDLVVGSKQLPFLENILMTLMKPTHNVDILSCLFEPRGVTSPHWVFSVWFLHGPHCFKLFVQPHAVQQMHYKMMVFNADCWGTRDKNISINVMFLCILNWLIHNNSCRKKQRRSKMGKYRGYYDTTQHGKCEWHQFLSRDTK